MKVSAANQLRQVQKRATLPRYKQVFEMTLDIIACDFLVPVLLIIEFA